MRTECNKLKIKLTEVNLFRVFYLKVKNMNLRKIILNFNI